MTAVKDVNQNNPLGYNASVEEFREQEYPMLKDNIYLDHAGTTLYSRSLVDRFAGGMKASLLGNPHAGSASSQAATQLVEDVRLRTLQFFRADPAEFDLVFVANATAGAKLVAEAFRALPGGFAYAYHQACHTSLVGVREEAHSAVCMASDDVERWTVRDERENAASPHGRLDTLFAYPAQSNMDGQRFPLSWADRLRKRAEAGRGGHRIWTLLDAAAFVSTSPLDLSDAAAAPDFVVVSFYKIFGFPDLGALLVRRPAEPLLDARRYFGGGTVDLVVCSPKEQWHAPKRQSLHDRLEDGTLPVHSITALGHALDTHAALFGSMARVAAHVAFLSGRLRTGLAALRHRSGAPVCRIYSPPTHHTPESDDLGNGPIVAFNVQNARGAWISLAEFEKLATLKRFHIRTGGVCNPGGIAAALGLQPWEMRQNFSAGLRCGSDDGSDDIVGGKPTGVIRASLGAMSTIADVDRFVAFVDEFYRDDAEPLLDATTIQHPSSLLPSPSTSSSSLFVASISVYPIKSCGAFQVPRGAPWEVRPEGLAWDREWCLLHRGTRRALSQKQYPQMALLRPVLDFAQGVLRVSYAGSRASKPEGGGAAADEVCIPLSDNPAMFAGRTGGQLPSASATTVVPPRSRASRVCGEEIAAQVYTSAAVNDFFSDALGVPCLLARFPPGGQGPSMRHAKAHLQKHQTRGVVGRVENSCSIRGVAAPPSPPDTDSERGDTASLTSNEASDEEAARRRRILLSNESPVLAIHMASLRALNEEIRQRHQGSSSPVPAAVFRANIVLDSKPPNERNAESVPAPYAEDGWTRLRIGRQPFRMLGACRRCHMVCINQETGAKSDEPFVTLTKTRRFDGKVFFGTHMGHDPDKEDGETTTTTRERQFPTITVGDSVAVE